MLWPSGVFEVWGKMIRKVKTLEGVDFDAGNFLRQITDILTWNTGSDDKEQYWQVLRSFPGLIQQPM